MRRRDWPAQLRPHSPAGIVPPAVIPAWAPAKIPAATVARSSRRAPAKASKASGSSAKTAVSRLISRPLVASEVPTSNHASQHSMVPMSISSRISTWRCRQIAQAVTANAANRNTSKFTQTARQ